jgi:replicative DNA helicase
MTRAVLPHDPRAERAVLGASLLGDDIWPIVADALKTEDFYEPRHQLVYAALARLTAAGSALDSVSLLSELERTGDLVRVGGVEYVDLLTDTIPFPDNVERHCAHIRELATVRAVHAAVSAIASEALEPIEDIGDFLDRAETTLSLATDRRRMDADAVHIGRAFEELIAAMTAQADRGGAVGHSTGLRKLDEYTGGMVPCEVVVVAGRPGMGKTAFALRVATGVAVSTKLPVVFFSIEMPRTQLCMRLVASDASLDQNKLRQVRLSRDEWDQMMHVSRELSRLGVYIEDSSTTTILDVRRIARRMKRKLGGIGLVVIDYLQLLRPVQRGRSREEEVAESSRLAKALAKELQVPVLALSQLSRKVDDRAGGERRPQLSDLRESGAIEQDADTILFIYRDEVYNRASADAGIAEIIIGKQRQGVTGAFPLAFRGEFTRFADLPDYEAQAWKKRQEGESNG